MLGKVTFGEHVNVLEKYCKGDISYTFFPKLKVIKGLISCSVANIYLKVYKAGWCLLSLFFIFIYLFLKSSLEYPMVFLTKYSIEAVL